MRKSSSCPSLPNQGDCQSWTGHKSLWRSKYTGKAHPATGRTHVSCMSQTWVVRYTRTSMLPWCSRGRQNPLNTWPHGSQCRKLQWFDGKIQGSIRSLTDENSKTTMLYECKVKDFPRSVETVFATCSTFFQKSHSFQVEIMIVATLLVVDLNIHLSGKAAVLVCLGMWNCIC